MEADALLREPRRPPPLSPHAPHRASSSPSSSHPALPADAPLLGETRLIVQCLALFALAFGVLGLLGIGWSRPGALFRVAMGLVGLHATWRPGDSLARRAGWLKVFEVCAWVAAGVEGALIAAEVGLFRADPLALSMEPLSLVRVLEVLLPLGVDVVYDVTTGLLSHRLYKLAVTVSSSHSSGVRDQTSAAALASDDPAFPGQGQRLGVV